ncbi:MAG: formyltransferase family protein [Sulfurimonas denitrificans]|nr:formyltransferase family protein [Sulfurimonas denitrificans]
MNKKIVMCGCCEVGYNIIDSLLKDGFHFDYFVVFTQDQAQKFQISGYKNFSELAQIYNIPLYIPQSYDLKSKEDLEFFQTQKFDLIIQGGWQRLFPSAILQTLSIGAIGVHGSSDFLPKGRGRSPLNWSIIENKTRFIMQIFIIKEGVDDGDVFDYEIFDINKSDTIRTLYYKYAIVVKRMLKRNINNILNNKLNVKKQIGKPTYYKKRTPQDGVIDWEIMDVFTIDSLIRAVAFPYPGAKAIINNQEYTIWQAQVFDTKITYEDKRYGECVEIFDENLLINCLGGLLLITKYKKQL